MRMNATFYGEAFWLQLKRVGGDYGKPHHVINRQGFRYEKDNVKT